jgi:hypothetical protein
MPTRRRPWGADPAPLPLRAPAIPSGNRAPDTVVPLEGTPVPDSWRFSNHALSIVPPTATLLFTSRYAARPEWRQERHGRTKCGARVGCRGRGRGGPDGAARARGRPLCPPGGAGAGAPLPGGPPGPGGAEERVAARGGPRRVRAAGRPAPAQRGHLGRRGGAGRPPRLRGGAPRRRRERRAHRGRDELRQEGGEVLRGGDAVHRRPARSGAPPTPRWGCSWPTP